MRKVECVYLTYEEGCSSSTSEYIVLGITLYVLGDCPIYMESKLSKTGTFLPSKLGTHL